MTITIDTVCGNELSANFPIRALFDSMTTEQKRIVAEHLALDETIIEYIVEQLCAGFVDTGNGWSVNHIATRDAREQIVARMDEFVEQRDRDLESHGNTERHRGMLDGISLAFERIFGEREIWNHSTTSRFFAAMEAARGK